MTEEVKFGEITIVLKPIDADAPGSYLQSKLAKSIGVRLTDMTDQTAHDDMVDFIIANADIDAPADVDVHDLLLSSASINAIRDMFKRIIGADAVPNPNGA